MNLLILIPSFLFAFTIHEFSHAITAKLLWDDTAEKMWRVTLNPLKHLDIFGTIMIFVVGFGWGKPVPVNSSYFKNPKRDNAIVSFAWPFSNLVLALVLITILKYYPNQDIFKQFLETCAALNIILAVFNLIPLPPLDGSHILELFIPDRFLYKWYEFQANGRFLLIIFVLWDNYFWFNFLSKFLFFMTDMIFMFMINLV